jgi:flagellar biosynthesis GTPase FlhF
VIAMQLHTFTARSLAEALRIVRDELGPDASLLHTRELGSPLARLLGGRRIEVTASVEVEVPSRLPAFSVQCDSMQCDSQATSRIPAAELQDYRQKFRQDLLANYAKEASVVELMSQASRNRSA